MSFRFPGTAASPRPAAADRSTARRRLSAGFVLVALALVLAACAAGPNEAAGAAPEAAGFWLGLWHGVITPVTFVVSLFTDDVSIYEVRNSGNWYDVGFVLGVAVAFSGGASSGRSARPRVRAT